MRTGQYYLNKGGPYADFFPEVLEPTDGHAVRRLRLPPRADEQASTSTRSPRWSPSTASRRSRSSCSTAATACTAGRRPELVPDDPGGRALRLRPLRVRHARASRRRARQYPELADQISLSLHCETAEIMAAYTKMVEEDGTLTGLAAYNASRPPHSEGLAVTIASYLAHETGLPTINLLHLTSRKAIEAALRMASGVPAHRLPPRGHHRSPARRLRHRARASAARSTRRCARARTSRRCGSTCSTATSTGSSATTPAAGTR